MTRVALPADGRATLAAITDDGRAALRPAAPDLSPPDIAEHLRGHVTETEPHVVAGELQRVVNAHDATVDPLR